MKSSMNTYLIAALSFFMCISCLTKTDDDVLPVQNTLPEYVSNAFVDGLRLPDNTRVVKTNPSTVELIYPEGIQLWAVDKVGNVKHYHKSTYSCTCSGSGGCNVFYAGGDFGCQHGECNGSCTGKRIEEEALDMFKYAFVDMSKKLTPIKNPNAYEALPYIPEFVLKHQATQSQLLAFAQKIYGPAYQKALIEVNAAIENESDIEKVVFIGMQIYGYKLVYGIAMSHLKTEVYRKNDFNTLLKTHSCNCTSGQSGCTKGSTMGVKYCEGGDCTTCQMTVEMADPGFE